MKEVIIHIVVGTQVATQDVRLAQLDRAFGYGPKGREFESSNAQYEKPRKRRCLRGFLQVYKCFGFKLKQHFYK